MAWCFIKQGILFSACDLVKYMDDFSLYMELSEKDIPQLVIQWDSCLSAYCEYVWLGQTDVQRQPSDMFLLNLPHII